MKTLTFTEFRKHASEVLDLVEKGERVRVLRHGRVAAKIVPAESRATRPSWKRPGLRLVAPGASLSKTILEERRRSDASQCRAARAYELQVEQLRGN